MADEVPPKGAGGGKWDGPTEYRPPAMLFTKRLGFRLGLLVCIAVIPLFALASISALRARDEAVRSAGREVGRLSRIAARNQEEAIAQANRVLEAAVAQPWTSGPVEGMAAELKAIVSRNPDFQDVQIVKPDGTIVASAVAAEEAARLFDRKVVETVVKLKQPAAGDFENPSKLLPRIYLARPLPGGMVLGASFSLAWLRVFQGLLSLPDGSVLDVVDPQGLNLLRLPKADRGDVGQIHPAPQLLRSVLPGEETPMVAEDTDGVRRYFGIAPLATGAVRKGFLIVVGIPEEGVIAAANRTLRTSLVGSAIVLLLSLVLAQVMAEQFVIKRVNGLILASKRLANTDLDKLKARTRVCQDPSELGDLERSFDDMAKKLEERAQELDRRAKDLESRGKG